MKKKKKLWVAFMILTIISDVEDNSFNFQIMEFFWEGGISLCTCVYWNYFPFLEPNYCFEKNETWFQENATRFSKMELRSIAFLFVTDFVEYTFPHPAASC